MEETGTFQMIVLRPLIYFHKFAEECSKALAVFVLWGNISVCYLPHSLLLLPYGMNFIY